MTHKCKIRHERETQLTDHSFAPPSPTTPHPTTPLLSKPPPLTMGNDMVEVKIVMVGDMSVGKTSLANRFTQGEFREDVRTTLGSTCLFKEQDVGGQRVRFSLWDTAGQEVYHSMVPVYFRQAAAVVLVYDVTSTDSYEGAKKWLTQIEEHAPSDVVVAIVGNKIDLPSRIDDTDAEEFDPPEFHTVKMDVSAKTGENINALFSKIYRKCQSVNPNPQRGSNTTINLSAAPSRSANKYSRCGC